MSDGFRSEYRKLQVNTFAKHINARLHTKFGFNNKKHDLEMKTKQECNDILYYWILDEKSKMVGRFGSVEAAVLSEYLAKEHGLLHHYSKQCVNSASNNAGIFPADEAGLDSFSEEMLDAMPMVDVLGSWPVPMQNFLENQCVNKECIGPLKLLEPYMIETDTPWSLALEGKKVLVIHPFENSIRSQYLKRDKLFPKKKILPSFGLYTIKAVQTIAGNRDPRFENWTAALDYMTEEALKIPFDVAILGCGGYGFPLAARLKKETGKIAIHMGGSTQLLFGIMGERWMSRPEYVEIFNDAWIRPSEAEAVKGNKNVEGGCYW